MVIIFTLHRREDVNDDGTLKPPPQDDGDDDPPTSSPGDEAEETAQEDAALGDVLKQAPNMTVSDKAKEQETAGNDDDDEVD